MEIVQQMISHIGLLYKLAYEKTDNCHDADDLVQETFLCTLQNIKNGTRIDNLKAYLIRILNNKYCDLIRSKNNKLMINYSDYQTPYMEEQDDEEAPDTEFQRSKETIAIRKELAYLSKIYREVMVQFYMQSKSVVEIADNLNVTKNVVLTRLNRGREKIKKGVKKMEVLSDNSFCPDSLILVPVGILGDNSEPSSIVTNDIEQNILILAYDKPVTVEEMSKKIGIPTAFVEGIINKLIENELMDVHKNKVQTNFLIINEELINNKKAEQKAFVDNHFKDVEAIFEDLVKEYERTGILKNYNKTQLYMYGIAARGRILSTFLNKKLNLMNYTDFPERPNGGKWIIDYSLKKASGNRRKQSQQIYFFREMAINTTDSKTFEIWETPFSKLPWKETHKVHLDNTNAILYDIYKGRTPNPQLIIRIPELLKLGYLKNNAENEVVVNIPVLTNQEYRKLIEVNEEFAKRYIDLMLERLLKFIEINKIDYPKHIKHVPPFVHLFSVFGLTETYILKAAEEGLIEIDKNKNYPLCMIVEKD